MCVAVVYNVHNLCGMPCVFWTGICRGGVYPKLVGLYWVLACLECCSYLAIPFVAPSWLPILGEDAHRGRHAGYRP